MSDSVTYSHLFENADRIALVANGEIHDHVFMGALISEYEKKVAVDGGLAHCHQMQLKPDLILGDCDSISSELLYLYRDVPVQMYPRDKGETDLEIALRLIDQSSVKKIGVFGALEKRGDHALTNFHLLLRYPKKAYIETEAETIFPIIESQEVKCYPGQLISLIPLGPPTLGVTTEGLKWELKGDRLDKNFLSISNICLGNSVKISIQEGELICFLSRKNP